VELKHTYEVFNVLVERKCRKALLNNVSPILPAVLDFVRDNHYIHRIELIKE
jgi:hypothetical protein